MRKRAAGLGGCPSPCGAGRLLCRISKSKPLPGSQAATSEPRSSERSVRASRLSLSPSERQGLVDFGGFRHDLFCQTRLSDVDPEWTTPSSPRSVHYLSLAPGSCPRLDPGTRPSRRAPVRVLSSESYVLGASVLVHEITYLSDSYRHQLGNTEPQVGNINTHQMV